MLSIEGGEADINLHTTSGDPPRGGSPKMKKALLKNPPREERIPH